MPDRAYALCGMSESRKEQLSRLASDPAWVARQFSTLAETIKEYAVVLLDPDGYIVTTNPGAQLIKGYKPDELVGIHFSQFYPQSAIDRGWPQHELEVARAEGRFEDEGWRVKKDGSMFWANVVITALRDQNGTLTGFGKITRDLSERRREQESLRQSEERFRLLVEAVEDYAIFMLDPNGKVMSWNAGAERIKGYSASEIIGRHFSTFYPPELIAVDWPSHELRVARTEGRYREEGWRIRKDGSRFWASVVLTAVFDRTGTLRGFAKVTRDLTQRQRVEELQEAGRQMSEFLAMLAHELRNPLAPIRNAMQIMGLRRFDDPQLEWSRNVVDRQIAHLGRLVDDLLDVNRITTGKILLKREAVSLALVLERAIESSGPLLEERKHRVDVDIAPQPLMLRGDPVRLAQVFLNLLNNAAKYTPEGGIIRVCAHEEGPEAVVRVRDNGLGIGSDLLPKVFDLFVQGSRSLDRAEGGLGIGLTLVREIVRLHGGAVSVTSGGTNRGSEFTVRLPLLVATAADLDVDRAQEAGTPTLGRRVLVVDDNRDSADSMAMVLGATGHDTRTAHDGPAALAIAAEYKPDYVLLDIGLPGMNGYAVAERLRAIPGCGSAVLIAMTGYGQEDDRRRSRAAGFDHHLVKPVDFDVLTTILNGETPSTTATP
jgi:PAS domain S-box-containing protein